MLWAASQISCTDWRTWWTVGPPGASAGLGPVSYVSRTCLVRGGSAFPGSVATRPQNPMAVRPTLSTSYDAIPAKAMMPKKFVTCSPDDFTEGA